MNSINKDFFSKSVHKYIVYADLEKSLEKYEKRILNELRLRNLNKDFFKNKVIVDIGTGFQSIIAHKFGAEFVYHLDLSKEQILWMQSYCTEKKIANIQSIQCDITKEIPKINNIDMVLFFGVWHHMDTPSNFIKNILPLLNPNTSSIWMRIYRSGTWSRWVTSNLRNISAKIDQSIVEEILNIRYPYDTFNQWKGDLLDDLYSPIWQSFHPKQFTIESTSSFVVNQSWDYNFNENDENFRVDFNLNNNNIEEFKKFTFPNKGINQQTLIFGKNYKMAIKVEELFGIWSTRCENPYITANKLLSIYDVVRKKTVYDEYTQLSSTSGVTPSRITAQKRLDMLVMLLEKFVKT